MVSFGGTMSKTRNRWLRLLALVFAFALVAAACGDSDSDTTDAGSDDSGEEAAPSEGESEGVEEDGGLSQDAIEDAMSGDDEEEEMAEEEEAEEAEEAAGDEACPSDRSTIEGIWAEADCNRDKIIAMISAEMEAGNWGVNDDNILIGPAGMAVDLNDCPDDWSNTQGLSDTEISFGQTTVLSGQLAFYGDLTLGMQIWFGHIADIDALSGRAVNMIIRDDGYVAAQTIEFTDELIESENIFLIQGLGSPNGLAVYDKINDECIPHPWYLSGHPAWGDPVNHPWTTAWQMSYSTEAVLWGTWIKVNLADQLPVKVAGLIMDNDFGLAYEDGFHVYAEANPDVVSEFIAVRHDPAAPTITNEITTIQAADPDVFISMTAGNACVLAIQEVENTGLRDTIEAAFTPSVCQSVGPVMEPAGEASDGWWVVNGGAKDTTDAARQDEPFIKFARQLISDAGEDPEISLIGEGIFRGYGFSEALRIADGLPGGMSRTNLLLALRNFKIWHPGIQDGLTLELRGNEDAYFVEGSGFGQFDFENLTWIEIGDRIDANGGTANCAWDKDNGGC